MKKILIAVDSREFDFETARFACHLARLTGSRLTAIFLEDSGAERKIAIEAIGQPDLQASLTLLEAELETENLPVMREKNILLFNQLARQEGVASSIYLDKGAPAEDLVVESLFADILILPGSIFSELSDEPPTSFVRTIVHDAGCPVIIAPETFSRIDDIVFCYDGSRSSIFAMKQFAYLFPQLASQRAKIIDIRDEITPSNEETRITSWLKNHFADVEWIARGPKASIALFNFLLEKADDIVVMGAYGKGLLTSFFTEDPDLGITRTTRLPIFIAHH